MRNTTHAPEILTLNKRTERAHLWTGDAYDRDVYYGTIRLSGEVYQWTRYEVYSARFKDETKEPVEVVRIECPKGIDTTEARDIINEACKKASHDSLELF